MAINAKIDGTTYSGIETINAGGKVVSLETSGMIDTPTKTKTITANGENIDVTDCASINVDVPTESSGTTPSGTVEITENGTKDVSAYAYANVNVPIPDGYVKPDGTLDVTANGTADVANYKYINVTVPTEGGADFTLSATSTKANYVVGTEASALSLVVTATFPNGDTATFAEWDAEGTVEEGTNQFTISAGGKTCVAEVNGIVDENALPDGYELCEYVQIPASSDGTGYFTIPYEENENTIIDASVALRNASLGIAFTNVAAVSLTGNYKISYGTSSSSTGYYGMTSSVAYEADVVHEFYIAKGTAKVDDETLTWKQSSVIDYGTELWVGRHNATQTIADQARIYSVKVLEGTDTKINLVPCLDATSKPCLYDTIGGTPYYCTAATYKLAE